MRQEIVGIGTKTCPFCREAELSVVIEKNVLKNGKVKSAVLKQWGCVNYPCTSSTVIDKISPEQAENIIQTALKGKQDTK